MSTINPSACNDPTAPHRREKQPQAFPVDFKRIDPKLSGSIGAARAVDSLNLHFMAFNGINAIVRLLRANDIARECAAPSIDNSVTDGLLAAAIALSRLAADEIEHLADSADDRAPEVRHG
ncbi:hypothetical protein [Burkholderia glumae]|uniref:hypothetical protein n=1 Tax=Burkholderia glumae TaxID=337 RepID=UPI0020CBA5F3|nr:hypothetical protein [Burkholderia glumae]MCQ0029684.1 hypothetical protein [Burkholderia glumae]MCQ0035498.1 hypothetical protein [Burkholderia glumae]